MYDPAMDTPICPVCLEAHPIGASAMLDDGDRALLDALFGVDLEQQAASVYGVSMLGTGLVQARMEQALEDARRLGPVRLVDRERRIREEFLTPA
jgi:hypothetical protein